MSKVMKKLSLLIGASFLLLTGCAIDPTAPNSSSSGQISYSPDPSYGNKLPIEDYKNASFTYDHAQVFDFKASSDACLLFSDFATLQDYTASSEAKVEQTGPTYEGAIKSFKSIEESFFNDYYLVVTPELSLGNALYSVEFEGPYLNQNRLTIRLIETKSEGTVNEVVIHYFFKVAISKKYQIDTVKYALERHY